ncbi:MAG: FadR family transcriptional regulator [Hyphomicrobiales bacterium]|nr:FadR family transcriptional regulator [Hyphomicrobiales bacterium]
MTQAVSPLFTSLGRRQAYVEVAEQIRAKILTDKLRLFARLPSERDLAAQFGVSRVVVREAIRTLESRGLVTVKKGPKGGIFVTQDYERPILDSVTNLLAVGEASLDDLFELRLLIEPYAAARLAAIGTADDFAKLDAVIAEAEREHRADHSIRDYYIDFHRSILRFTRNPLLGIIGETIVLVLYDRVKTAISAETTEIGLIMHRQLVDACRQRRDEEARSIMMQDIEILRRRFVAFSSGGNERAERGGEQKANGPAISGNRLW